MHCQVTHRPFWRREQARGEACLSGLQSVAYVLVCGLWSVVSRTDRVQFAGGTNPTNQPLAPGGLHEHELSLASCRAGCFCGLAGCGLRSAVRPVRAAAMSCQS